MPTEWNLDENGTLNVSVDATSPEAHRAAELARQLVRARLGEVSATWGAELDVILNEIGDNPVMRSALLMALANVAHLALTGWAGNLAMDTDEAPTAERLLDHLADVCERRGLTI